MFGLGNLAGLVQDGHVPGAIVTYLSAAAGTALGAATGTTPLIIAAESAVGIKEGGRTGLVSITVAFCFACSMFLAPFMQVRGGIRGGGYTCSSPVSCAVMACTRYHCRFRCLEAGLFVCVYMMRVHVCVLIKQLAV